MPGILRHSHGIDKVLSEVFGSQGGGKKLTHSMDGIQSSRSWAEAADSPGILVAITAIERLVTNSRQAGFIHLSPSQINCSPAAVV